jgi:hypothetical protein
LAAHNKLLLKKDVQLLDRSLTIYIALAKISQY